MKKTMTAAAAAALGLSLFMLAGPDEPIKETTDERRDRFLCDVPPEFCDKPPDAGTWLSYYDELRSIRSANLIVNFGADRNPHDGGADCVVHVIQRDSSFQVTSTNDFPLLNDDSCFNSAKRFNLQTFAGHELNWPGSDGGM